MSQPQPFSLINHPVMVLGIILAAAATALALDPFFQSLLAARRDELAHKHNSPAIVQLNPDESAALAAPPLLNGQAACGVFAVNGHGNKLISLTDFPRCAGGTLQVGCLDESGEWTHAGVSRVQSVDDGQSLRLTAGQYSITLVGQRHRIVYQAPAYCAFFTAEP